MSLDALVAEVGQALGDARRLYGPAPAPGEWSSTGGLATGHDAVAQSSGSAAQNWSGASSSTYVRTSGGSQALDAVIGADQGTSPGFGATADTSRDGRGGMDGPRGRRYRAGVAALAPSTDTPAGKQQLVNHLHGQLDRAKALLQASERRNVA
jgi:hypothetical protein